MSDPGLALAEKQFSFGSWVWWSKKMTEEERIKEWGAVIHWMREAGVRPWPMRAESEATTKYLSRAPWDRS